MKHVLASVLLATALPCSAELHVLESRHHVALADEVARGAVSETTVEALAEHALPEFTVIRRGWFRGRIEAGANPGQAVRRQTVVLAEIDQERIRFRYDYRYDYGSGIHEIALKIWDKMQRVDRLEVRMEHSPFADNVGEAAGVDLEDLPKAWEVLCHFSYGGREWTMPVDDWTSGSLTAVDRELLDKALDARLLELLESVALVAKMDPKMVMLCMYVTAPLLRHFDDERCLPEDAVLSLLSGDTYSPDCEFDARFAEPCTDTQLQQWRARVHKELAEPPPD